jgi:predicted dehydrogenase
MIATQQAISSLSSTAASTVKPRIGFLGVGWIGRHRMEALARSGLVEITAIADPASSQAEMAAQTAPGAAISETLEEILALGVDGVVIATPSALHAVQAELALSNGVAVFCQKPLGRTGPETRRVIATAKEADRLLGVDLSYRHLIGVRKISDLCRSGALGKIYALDLVFHNAYGPDKPWFYNPSLSGGGCVMDLGIHLVDLGLWTLGFPPVTAVSSRLFCKGKPISTGRVFSPMDMPEDYAEVRIDTDTGVCIRLTCSWKLQAGRDAIIGGAFYGTEGGAAFHNVDGSFYEFAAERFTGTKTESLSCGPEEWGGKAIIDWAQRLALSRSFDPGIETLLDVADVLDEIYQSSRDRS